MTAVQDYVRLVRQLGPRIKPATEAIASRQSTASRTGKRFSRRRKDLNSIDMEAKRLLRLAELELEKIKRLSRRTRRGTVLNSRKTKSTKRQG